VLLGQFGPRGEGTTATAGKRVLHINEMSYELAPEQDMGDALIAVNALTGAGSGAQRFKVVLDGITPELFVSPAHVLTAAAYDRGHHGRASSVQDIADR